MHGGLTHGGLTHGGLTRAGLTHAGPTRGSGGDGHSAVACVGRGGGAGEAEVSGVSGRGAGDYWPSAVGSIVSWRDVNRHPSGVFTRASLYVPVHIRLRVRELNVTA